MNLAMPLPSLLSAFFARRYWCLRTAWAGVGCCLVLAHKVTPVRAEVIPIGIHKFTLPEGLQVELVAGPPQVLRPVTMALDELGALYVADSSGSNARPTEQVQNPTHTIVKLVDADGDGKYEKRSLFAEKLSFPEGTLWLGGSLYVAAPPVILKFTDTNHDGVSDKREVWYDGKTLTNCANDLHGPYAGLDGRIYWTKGAFAEQRHKLADGREFVTRASHVFRAKPDGSSLEVVMGGGMDNPVDVVFSPQGDLFLSNTFLVHPRNGQRDGILHAVYGGLWGKDHGVLEGHARTGDLLPVMSHLGPAAASGLEMCQNVALGQSGRLLCAQFNLRKVSSHWLIPDQATFRSQDTTLLESDHRDFHPTDVLEDADGSVLVADTGGWYKICCPTSQLEKPEVLGGIYRIKRKPSAGLGLPATGVRLDPRETGFNWEAASAEALALKMSSPFPAVSSRAARLLSARGEVAVLAILVTGPGHPLQALWALTRIDSAAARQAVRGILASGNPPMQRAAAASVSLWRDREAVPLLLPLLNSLDPHLQRAAVEALGRCGSRTEVPALLRAKYSMGGRFTFHSAAMALSEIATLEDLAIANTDEERQLAATVKAMLELPRPATAATLPLLAPATPPAAEMLAQQRDRLQILAKALPKGDAARGADLFRGAKAACSTCHAISGEGGKLGPDLTKAGAIRSPEDLLEAIVFPSRSYVRSYEPLLVKLKSGKEHLGILRDQTTTELTLTESPLSEVKLPRLEIAELKEGPYSLMPPIADGLLTPEELADLVRFLTDRK